MPSVPQDLSPNTQHLRTDGTAGCAPGSGWDVVAVAGRRLAAGDATARAVRPSSAGDPDRRGADAAVLLGDQQLAEAGPRGSPDPCRLATGRAAVAELPGGLGFAPLRDLDLEQRLPDRHRDDRDGALLLDRRLRVRAVPLPRQVPAVQPDPGDVDAAGLREADPQLSAVLEARLA